MSTRATAYGSLSGRTPRASSASTRPAGADEPTSHCVWVRPRSRRWRAHLVEHLVDLLQREALPLDRVPGRAGPEAERVARRSRSARRPARAGRSSWGTRRPRAACSDATGCDKAVTRRHGPVARGSEDGACESDRHCPDRRSRRRGRSRRVVVQGSHTARRRALARDLQHPGRRRVHDRRRPGLLDAARRLASHGPPGRREPAQPDRRLSRRPADRVRQLQHGRDLYVSHADGSALRRVPASGSELRYLTFSPDGSTVAIVRSDDDEHPHLVVVDADGRNLRKLGRAGPPDWSPNGELLAFHTGRGCVVTTARFTSEQGRIPGPCGVPEFSPDSGSLAFETGSHCAVAATPLPGRLAALARERRLLPGNCDGPTWSPDGRWIAYVSPGCPYCESPKAERAALKDVGVWIVRPGWFRPPARRPGRRGGRRALLVVSRWLPPCDRRGLAAPGRVAHRPDEAHRPAARVRLVRVAALVGRRHSSDRRGAHG